MVPIEKETIIRGISHVAMLVFVQAIGALAASMAFVGLLVASASLLDLGLLSLLDHFVPGLPGLLLLLRLFSWVQVPTRVTKSAVPGCEELAILFSLRRTLHDRSGLDTPSAEMIMSRYLRGTSQ